MVAAQILKSVKVSNMPFLHFVNWKKKHTTTSGKERIMFLWSQLSFVVIKTDSHDTSCLFIHSCTPPSMDLNCLMRFSHLFSRDSSLNIYQCSPLCQIESVHNMLLTGRRNQGSGKD